MAEFKVGQLVETATGQEGLVKYVGPIHVAEGTWLGVQLDEPNGKNDGSVRGERYFTCPPAHGLFVKPSSITQIISQPAPAPAPKPAAPRARVASTATPASRPRPSSVIAPKPAPRTSTVNKRQSVAPGTSYTPSRNPIRKPSVAGPSVTAPSDPAESSRRPTTTASRPSISSTTSNTTVTKATRDGNVETLQTKIRHLEKQRSEDQEKLRELAQTKDERDRYRGIIEKLQTKGKEQYDNIKTLEQQLQVVRQENDKLNKNHEEFEVENEHALIDKEMAEERADQAEAEVELLRKKIEERDLELDILREEAELFTAEMTEEEKQDAGFYRLQHENDRLRQALIGLKEMTEEKELDLKNTISSLETDLTQLETLVSENIMLQERAAEAEALAEDLKQRLEAAEEADDMVEELSSQNQNLQDRVAEQELIIQDLENLRELNDELEIQHLEQEEEMRADIEAKDNELAEQANFIHQQSYTITEQETMLSKFRDLVLDLQTQVANAEDSKTMTEAQVKDTTGRFNEVMDLNRQLRATTVQSTAREIDAELIRIKNTELSTKLDIWDTTGSKDFVKSDSLNSYVTAKTISRKAELLMQTLQQTDKQTNKAGRLEDTLACVQGTAAATYLAFLRDYSDRLFNAIACAPLQQFSVFGPMYRDLTAIESIIDQGLNALKADAVNYDELAGALGRSSKIYEAMLANHQAELMDRPEDDFLFKVKVIETRLVRIDALYTLALSAFEKVPESVSEYFTNLHTQFKMPADRTRSAIAAVTTLKKTLFNLRKDSMYPKTEIVWDGLSFYDERLSTSAENFSEIVQKLIEEIIKCCNAPDDNEKGTCRFGDYDDRKHRIEMLDLQHENMFGDSGLTGINMALRDKTDMVSILLNNVEIEQKPAPWVQKAKEVEAARKKDEEVARQLQTLTSEHIATVLKINEREQVISTKELEIEHLMAKNRDAVAKMGDVEALQAELKERGDRIVSLKAEQRALLQEMQALRERGAQSDLSVKDENDLTPTNAVTPAAEPSDPWAAGNPPFQLKVLIDALQNENHWLRQREHKARLDRNLYIMGAHFPERNDIPQTLPPFDVWLAPSMISDDETEEDEAPTPEEVSSPRTNMTPLALREVQLGWQSRAESLKEALESAEESMLSTIYEEDESSCFNILV